MVDPTEVIVTGRRPLVARRLLEDSLASGKALVVITDRAGRHPTGSVPADGVVVSVMEVTEAVKIRQGVTIVASIDRSDLVEAVVPVLLARSTLARVLEQTDSDPVDVVAVVAEMGGIVVPDH